MPASDESNEIHITRVYDAPVKAVWDAWTDPAQVAQWWGPRGFTITTHGKDLRTGGFWSYTMHGPDGTDYPNTTKYLDVVKHAKLVYDHGGHADRPPMFRVTVLFSEKSGKTTMDMTMTLPTPEAAKDTRGFIKKAGGNATWDRLAEYLAKHGSGKEQFVINRTFDAPVDLLFQMWTDPEHFAKWLPPTGMTMRFIRADIRPGGSAFFKMTDGKGTTLYGRCAYQAIEKPGLIVYTQQFCDEHENVGRHPFVPTWPLAMLTRVELIAEGEAQTRVTITWEPLGPLTPGELATFVGEKGGMTQGWSGSFDKLEALLAEH